MPVKFRMKNRRMRGKTTHGWGTKKKHRGSGSQGGAGWGGAKKGKRTFIYAHEPEHFGKKGFFSLHKKINIINVGDLEEIAGEAKEIDLNALNYQKLLSRGIINKPLHVTVSSCSPRAKEKIEKAGGKIIS